MNQRDGRVGGRTPEQSTVRPLNDSGGGRALTQAQAKYRELEAVAAVVADIYVGHKELDLLQRRHATHSERLGFCIMLAQAIETEAAERNIVWDSSVNDWVELVELTIAHWRDTEPEPHPTDCAAAAFNLQAERQRVAELQRNDIVEGARLGATATLSAAGDKLIEVAAVLREIAEELGPAMPFNGCRCITPPVNGVCPKCGARKVAR